MTRDTLHELLAARIQALESMLRRCHDGRRAWNKTHLGEQPLNKAEAHRLAHKLRDPKFYAARTKRAVNSGGVR